MKILFVINPRSGAAGHKDIEKQISKLFPAPEWEYRIHLLAPGKNPEKPVDLAIREFDPKIVACGGGDGTVNMIAALLLDTPMTLAIIPMGSANGMARELGITDIPASLNHILAGKRKRIDMLKVNNHFCLHLADVGFNARIVKRFEEDPRRGLYTYARYLFNELFLIKKYRFRIDHDAVTSHFRAVSLTFANASKYGTGAVINPVGKINDGRFELVIVHPFPRIHLLSIAWKMFRGNLQSSEYVTVLSCREAKIFSSRKTTLQIDGEVIGKVKEISVRALPSVLELIVP